MKKTSSIAAVQQRASTRLREIAERLRAMQSATTVAVTALRAQNADIDEDIARLLIRSISDPLQDQIDAIHSVLRMLATSSAGRRKRKPRL